MKVPVAKAPPVEGLLDDGPSEAESHLITDMLQIICKSLTNKESLKTAAQAV